MLFLESINHSCSSSSTAGKPLLHLPCFYAFALSEWLKELGFSSSPRPEMVASVVWVFAPSHYYPTLLWDLKKVRSILSFSSQFQFSSYLVLASHEHLHLRWALEALLPSMRFTECSQKLFFLLLAVAYVNAAMWHSLSAPLKPHWLHLDQSLLNFCLFFWLCLSKLIAFIQILASGSFDLYFQLAGFFKIVMK